jgi:Carbohydrate-selective porin
MNMKNPLRLLTTTGSLALLTLPLASRADEPAADATDALVPEKSAMMRFFEQDYLLGTWGGLRTDLSKRGIDFEFFYISSVPNNLSGGIKTGSAYQGALLMLLDVDSKKLLGYEGGHFHVGGVTLHGSDHFSDEHIGDFNKVNLVDFPNAWRLWELWYEQKFLNDKFSVKFGQMAVDQDFLTAEFYNSLGSINFLNQTFFYPTLAFNVYDVPVFPAGSHALASSPYGAPGVRLKFNITDNWYVQAAAYDGYPDQKDGTRINLNKNEGALLYFETGIRVNQGRESTGLPGNYKLGGFYHTDDFWDNYSTLLSLVGETPTSHSGTWGLYFLADQYLYQEIGKDDPAKQGLVGFFRVAGAPSEQNLTQFGVDGGLLYKGLIPTRDWDSFGVAASYLEMSDDLRRAQREINSMLPGAFPHLVDYEAVIEVSYKAQVTAWWTVHLSGQRPIHPGGSADNRDAWVVVLGSTLRF